MRVVEKLEQQIAVVRKLSVYSHFTKYIALQRKSPNYLLSNFTNTLHYKKVKEGATTMMEEIDKGMDQLKEQYIEPYVNQRRPSKGQQIKTVDGCEQKSIFRIMK